MALKHLLVLDYETYYDTEFSLRKISTPEYILGDKFSVHMVAAWDVLRWSAPKVIDAEAIPAFLASYPKEETRVISHNALFDMSICAWVYNWIPGQMLDTLGMARALRDYHRYSLGYVAEKLLGHNSKDLGVLGKVRGMTAVQIKQAGLWPDMCQYAMNDARLCFFIYQKLFPEFPADERTVMDLVIRATVDPVFEADVKLLDDHLVDLRRRKRTILSEAGYAKAALMSTQQFQDALERLGVAIAFKKNAKGKEIPAFAKTDKFMAELQEYCEGNDDDTNFRVQTLASARLQHKSTLEETRAERFATIGKLNWPHKRPMMPVPLRYGGAHTHRLSGEWGINLQNLPRDTSKSKLRLSLRAPEGHKVLAADLSQIEARLVATLCGQTDLVQAFGKGTDVYAQFAEVVFGRAINKRTEPVERFIGKTCLSEGTRVYTERGLVAIEAVRPNDRVWDGEEWVCHRGVAFNGWKKTVPLCGIWLTPDHLVWSGTNWQPASLYLNDKSILCRALESAAASLRLQAIYGGREALPRSSFAAIAGANIHSQIIHSRLSVVQDAIDAQNSLVRKNVGGNTPQQCLMITIVHACLTVWLNKLIVVITQPINAIRTTEGAEFLCTVTGAMTDLRSYNMYRQFLGGTTPLWTSTVSTIIKDMNRKIFDFVHTNSTLGIDEQSRNSEHKFENLKRKLPVYDLLSTGPKNRFMIHTDQGPILVHNCILGLGYGCGVERFNAMVTSQARLAQIPLRGIFDSNTAARAVQIYRSRYDDIPAGWKQLDGLIGRYLYSEGDHTHLWPDPVKGPLTFTRRRIELPNGLFLRYDNTPREDLWGGIILENCLSATTKVLTPRGWVAIVDVQPDDDVFDGTAWVSHGGVVERPAAATVELDGVRMTPDHKVLTADGWVRAAFAEGLQRTAVRLPDSDPRRGVGWETATVGDPLRLRQDARYGRSRFCGWAESLLRLSYVGDAAATEDAWNVSASGVLGMALDARSMSFANTSGVEKLRRAWHHGLQALERVRTFLGGHGSDVSIRTDARTTKQQRKLYAEELLLGEPRRTSSQQAQQSPDRYAVGDNDGIRSFEASQDRAYDASLSAQQQLAFGQAVHPSKCPEPVFDILNCGPRQRFVVLGADGPFIVHNCCQALARVHIMQAASRLGRMGLRFALQGHDELVFVLPDSAIETAKPVIMAEMTHRPDWLPGLPLAAEFGIAQTYGEAK